MELSEVRVRLEYIQEIEGELQRFLVVVSECAGYRPKQGFMLQHVLHVFIRETQVQKAHRTLNLVLYLLLIETLDVAIEVFHADFRKVKCWTLCFLQQRYFKFEKNNLPCELKPY